MIEIQSETLIRIADVPAWSQEILDNRVHKSTVHRWHLRGCRGVRLETLMVGGIRHTSHQALERFFDRITAASSREPALARQSLGASSKSHQQADLELQREGF